MKRIIVVTGGVSSGKSAWAERRALELSPTPMYVATARPDGMEERIEAHRARRGEEWTVVEEPLRLGSVAVSGVAMVDCVTLWLTNLLLAGEADKAEDELAKLLAQDATLIFVTNEVGLGGVPENALARRFADLQGRVNQFLADRADEVTMVVSGIPIKIK